MAGAVVLGTLAFPAASGAATTFTVNSTLDPGIGTCDATECTLREAIDAANATSGTDTIAFNITGLPPYSIKPLTDLPFVTDPVVIDATTQPGYSCAPIVELDGTLNPTGTTGLTVIAGPSTVRGFVINRFLGGNGLTLLTSGAGGSRVDTNYIGTDATGTLSGFGNGSVGIEVFGASNTRLGDPSDPCRANLVSGNGRAGITIRAGSFEGPATGNLVQNNLIGLNASGTSAVPNLSSGVQLSAGGNTIGGTAAAERNLISGNGAHGIDIFGSGNTVQGNLVGTDAAGTAAVANLNGMLIQGGTNNLIGGTAAGARNVISGNTQEGVQLANSGTNGNTLQGNYIGTDVTGGVDLGNRARGLVIGFSATSNTVGGTAAGAGNVISGNDGGGVQLVLGGDNNTLQGNLVGTNAAGTGPLGNSLYGIRVVQSSGNTIGGTGSGAGDVIAFNSGPGVHVVAGTQNAILANSIYDNGSIGIDLIGGGPTPNDPGDADPGANNLQNFPVLTSASSNGLTTTTVQGTLNSTPSTQFRVEFFSSPSCDPSGFGEGNTFLGSQSVTTDASGNASFTATVPTGTAPGDVVTSTATDPANNTSEFSSCVASVGAPGKISARGRVLTEQGPPIVFSAANDCIAAQSTRPSIVSNAVNVRIWTKTVVTGSNCTDAPPASPLGFDTQTGTATGTFGPGAPGGLNGQQGTLEWTYHNGSPDTVEFTLRDSSNGVVYEVAEQTPGVYRAVPGGVWTFAP